MAEDKKTFIQGKMNQDIDDRILPNGEYRSAQNIQVTTSEESDVGSIQNILGNSIIDNKKITGFTNLQTIGSFFDETNNRIFYFVTNYTCENPIKKGLVGAADGPETAEQNALRTGDNLFCGIFLANNSNNVSAISITTLVSGLFLNFSKTNLITGVNLIEDLLFFTDGLNQPRKINVSTAITEGEAYYNKEEKISVAKFAPFMPPLLLEYDTTTLNGNPQATTTDSSGQVINVPPTSSMELSSQNDFPEDFIKEKFVRFSYRYRFVDGEYSTIAPFTQICFIPKTPNYNITQLQKVFKKGEVYFQDTSGISDGMVNAVNAVNLNIILPSKKIKTDLDINAIEILYKESDNNLIRAIELIDLKDVDSVNGVFQYKYKSTLPYKTLPQDQLTRVYDNVPLSAQAQEIISNRVIYGNYVEQRKLPNQENGAAGLNFSVGSTFKYDKENFAGNSDFNNYYLHKEYPFHSIKQRRTYEVGVVLSDKFGRQSPVLTSTSGVGSVQVAAKDSNFHSSSWDTGDANDPNSSGGVIIPEISHGDQNYCGDALSITFNEKIPDAYANGTFIPINNTGLNTITYANDVYKTTFATDPILNDGLGSGTGVVLGSLFYYSTIFVPVVGVTDFLYLDSTLQTVLTGHNEVYMNSGFNTTGSTVQIHKINLNFTTGAVEQVSTVSQSVFQSALLGSSMPVLVASSGTTANITIGIQAVTPIQDAQTNNPYSLGPNAYVLTITNFNQTDLFSVGDYLKGQDTDFVEIISIQEAGSIPPFDQGLNIFTDGPASLSYTNYTGSSNSPVFDAEDVDKYSFYKYNLVTHGWYSYRVVVKQPEQEYYNVYAPGVVSFDDDQDEDKTYIPIASDSINKITRDVEFTSTQDEGLSTSKNRVYPKVVPDNSFATNVGDALSVQSDADLLDVISVGTAKEQGLKNDNEDVFAFVYESTKNTLMAQLPFGDDNINVGTSTTAGLVGSTKTITSTNDISENNAPASFDIKLKNQGKILTWTDSGSASAGYEDSFTIGSYLKGANKDLVKIIKFHPIASNVLKVECDGAIDAASLGLDTEEVPATIDVRIYEYKYGIQDKISVFETKPFESVLDIYYETSTAGLVHELNEIVDFPTTVKSINLINKNFSENVEYFDEFGNFQNEHVAELQLFDQFENELTFGSAPSQIQSCSIISELAFYHQDISSELAGTSVVSNKFEIILDSNTNKFKIRPIDGVGNFVYHPESSPIKYEFLILVTNNSNEQEQVIVEIELENDFPFATAINNINLIGSEGLLIYDFLDLGAHNGSADENQQGLFFVNDGTDGTDNTGRLIGFVDNVGTSLNGFAGGNPFDNGEYNSINQNKILTDTNGNPIPELSLNNQTGKITLTSFFKGTLNVSVKIRIIDSDDFGIIQTSDDSQNTRGGKSITHTLNIAVNDGLIVLETDTDGHLVEFIGNTFLPLEGGESHQVFNNNGSYWTHFPGESQQNLTNSQLDKDVAGVFLFSVEILKKPNPRADLATKSHYLYALNLYNGVPKIVRYTYSFTFEPTDNENYGRTYYANHWLAKEQDFMSGLFTQQPGGFIFKSFAFSNPTNFFNQSTDIDGPGPDDYPEFFNSIEQVDPDQQYWKQNLNWLESPYGHGASDTEGYFAVYGDGESVSTGIAQGFNRTPAELNRSPLIKAKDTIDVGGFTYNILYDLRKGMHDGSQGVQRVFLARVQD